MEYGPSLESQLLEAASLSPRQLLSALLPSTLILPALPLPHPNITGSTVSKNLNDAYSSRISPDGVTSMLNGARSGVGGTSSTSFGSAPSGADQAQAISRRVEASWSPRIGDSKFHALANGAEESSEGLTGLRAVSWIPAEPMKLEQVLEQLETEDHRTLASAAQGRGSKTMAAPAAYLTEPALSVEQVLAMVTSLEMISGKKVSTHPLLLEMEKDSLSGIPG